MANKKKPIERNEQEPEVKPVENSETEAEKKEEKPVHCGTVRL